MHWSMIVTEALTSGSMRAVESKGLRLECGGVKGRTDKKSVRMLRRNIYHYHNNALSRRAQRGERLEEATNQLMELNDGPAGTKKVHQGQAGGKFTTSYHTNIYRDEGEHVRVLLRARIPGMGENWYALVRRRIPSGEAGDA